MDLNVSHIIIFIKYFAKYNDNSQLSGHQIGAFKTHNKDAYAVLKSDLELSDITFCQFFYKAFERCKVDTDQMTPHIFSYISQIIKKDTDQAYGQSHFTKDEITYFNNYIINYTNSFEGLGISNPFISQISETPQHTLTPSNTQTINTLSELNNSIDQETFCNFFEKMEQSLINKLQQAVHNQVGEELQKHLGISKNLTSPEVNELRNKLGYTYQSIMKKENQIKILETHIQNITTPEKLKHYNFPKPFNAFETRTLYISKYNKIIEKAQIEIMQLEINEFKEDLIILNNDLDVYLKTLRHYVNSIEETKNDIYEFQENVLKKSLNAAHVKVTKMRSSPYVAKHLNNTTNNKSNPNSSKQFQTNATDNNTFQTNARSNSKQQNNNTFNRNKNSNNNNSSFNRNKNSAFNKNSYNQNKNAGHNNNPRQAFTGSNSSHHNNSRQAFTGSNPNQNNQQANHNRNSYVNKNSTIPLLNTYPTNCNYNSFNIPNDSNNSDYFFRNRSKNRLRN